MDGCCLSVVYSSSPDCTCRAQSLQKIGNNFPTNTPRGFQVETTWKRFIIIGLEVIFDIFDDKIKHSIAEVKDAKSFWKGIKKN